MKNKVMLASSVTRSEQQDQSTSRGGGVGR